MVTKEGCLFATCGTRPLLSGNVQRPYSTTAAQRSTLRVPTYNRHLTIKYIRGFRAADVSAQSMTGIIQVNRVEELPKEQETLSSVGIDGMWQILAEKYGDSVALEDPHALADKYSYTFRELEEMIMVFAKGLMELGLEQHERVSLFSENSSRWLIADQSVFRCGAVDAVRGASSSSEELKYILSSSKSKGLVVQDEKLLQKLLSVLEDGMVSCLKFIIVLWSGSADLDSIDARIAGKVKYFDQVLDMGFSSDLQPPNSSKRTRDDLATLVYTSGTTGEPKGVRLSHGNIMYQMENFDEFIHVLPKDTTLSLLPPWHVYERSATYYLFSKGARVVYTNARKMKEDLSRFTPDYFVCVPLVLDTLRSRVLSTLRKSSVIRRAIASSLLSASISVIRARRILSGTDIESATQKPSLWTTIIAWFKSVFLWPCYVLAQVLVASKIRKAIGIKKTVISGGGSLGPYLDDFYEALQIPVLNGWGLTECSPVLACRSMVREHGGNIRGTVGRAISGTSLRIVDPETFEDKKDGEKGLILAKGPGVFLGYDSNEEATRKAFHNEYFITGDLGWRVPTRDESNPMGGCIVLQGRAKDTIVLINGENVEPAALEDEICRSPLIKFAILIGSGHRSLGALIVPDIDALSAAQGKQIGDFDMDSANNLLFEAVQDACKTRASWEKVTAIQVIDKPFSFEDGTLTRTMKPRRPNIMQKYAHQVEKLEGRLR
eukprot:jgi/Picsp_1/3746/NSC_06582-R2_long-chain-fatty-acid-- ligase